MSRFLIHYGFHFLFPFLISYLFYRKQFLKTYLILIAGIIIDIDHLLATPVFDATRCSIGFHPLHSYIAILFYTIMTGIREIRIFGIALLIHILADSIDCFMIN
ncbi:DUF6122 family protein [Leptobacterium sp. I13]|uniref:DUF6122 family protein n=1 Tax=Leptobacterium meishanense TaxID=3128904 RepID=UPI0030EF3A46